MPKINCRECKHYKYCRIRKIVNNDSNLVYCPIRHINNYQHFRKREKYYLKQLENQKTEQTTLEGI